MEECVFLGGAVWVGVVFFEGMQQICCHCKKVLSMVLTHLIGVKSGVLVIMSTLEQNNRLTKHLYLDETWKTVLSTEDSKTTIMRCAIY